LYFLPLLHGHGLLREIIFISVMTGKSKVGQWIGPDGTRKPQTKVLQRIPNNTLNSSKLREQMKEKCSGVLAGCRQQAACQYNTLPKVKH